MNALKCSAQAHIIGIQTNATAFVHWKLLVLALWYKAIKLASASADKFRDAHHYKDGIQKLAAVNASRLKDALL